jgi:hypothetical protein
MHEHLVPNPFSHSILLSFQRFGVERKPDRPTKQDRVSGECKMTSIVTKIAIAAAVAIGAFGMTAPAQAGGVDVNVKIKTPHVIVKPAPRVVIVKPAPVIVIKKGYGRCEPGLALAKASRNGLNKVAISHIGPNRVVVSGKAHGSWAKVSFANVRGCPRL